VVDHEYPTTGVNDPGVRRSLAESESRARFSGSPSLVALNDHAIRFSVELRKSGAVQSQCSRDADTFAGEQSAVTHALPEQINDHVNPVVLRVQLL
jgi:hypothetical protein